MGDIIAWDVSKVTSMREMFRGASSFNQPLGSWQVGQVTNFYAMFYQAYAINQDISGWNVSQATSRYSMDAMFSGGSAFAACNTMALDTSACPNIAVHDSFEAQNPSRWEYTYSAKTYLSQAVAQWSSNATSARARFGPISAWDVSAVTDMAKLFQGNSGFDEDINAWDVSKVTSMREMFRGASSFNQPLGSWQVGQVTNLLLMFYQASAINQDISGWNVSQATDMRYFLDSASAFAACNTMALDTSSCPNIAVHDSFEAQNPSRWPYTYSAKTYLSQAVAQWSSNATSARERFGPISAWDVS